MKHLSPEEASAQGYRAITNDCWPETAEDKPIIKSLELTLSSIDAVWIDMPYGAIQAARKKSQLKLPPLVLKELTK